jgi:glutaredoxin
MPQNRWSPMSAFADQATDDVLVYVRRGDPDCAAAIAFLEQRGIRYSVRDVTTDPSASAVLFGRLGRVVVPVIQQGDRLLVGYDPLQLARFFPSQPAGGGAPAVSFGAAVRSVSPELARERGLPWTYGVEVGPVREDTPAHRAGITPGDIITAIGAYTLSGGADQFRTAVAARKPGDAMSLSVLHDGEERIVEVEFPREATANSE